MVVTLHSLADVTLDTAWQVGFENSGIALSDGVKARIGECREAFERLLASDSAGFVYGSTAALGARAKTPLSAESQRALASSQNLWAPKDFLITTQAKRNLSSRSGIGGVLSAT